MRRALRLFLLREVERGDMIPRFYGIAWQSWMRETATVMPIPLNVVVSFARWLYFTCVRGFPRHWNDRHGKWTDGCVCRRCGRLMHELRTDAGRE